MSLSTRNLPLPQGIKVHSCLEGFIGAAGSIVSETAIGAVDLTQIIGIASGIGNQSINKEGQTQVDEAEFARDGR